MSEVALFIHSTATGPFMWAPFAAQCPNGLRPLAPVNRGYAPHDLLARGTEFRIADEVLHLKSQLPEGTSGVHLVAHSYGAFAALMLALDPQVPVRSLWLYEPVLFGSLQAEADRLPPDVAEQVEQLFSDPDFLLNEARGGDEGWIERFIDYWNFPGMWAAMPEKAKAMTRLVGWKMFQEVRMVSREPHAFESYRLDIPMTLVRGARTTPPARQMVQRLAEVNPHAQVDTLAGQGHMAIVAAPDVVQPSLAQHWARVVRT